MLRMRRVTMASKMLVDRSASTPTENRDVFYCVPCMFKNFVLEDTQLEHKTVVGEEICIICERRIADLPEPPTYPYEVVVKFSVLFDMEASSPAEARSWLRKAFGAHGIEIVEWIWTPEEKKFSVDWRF